MHCRQQPSLRVDLSCRSSQGEGGCTINVGTWLRNLGPLSGFLWRILLFWGVIGPGFQKSGSALCKFNIRSHCSRIAFLCSFPTLTAMMTGVRAPVADGCEGVKFGRCCNVAVPLLARRHHAALPKKLSKQSVYHYFAVHFVGQVFSIQFVYFYVTVHFCVQRCIHYNRL